MKRILLSAILAMFCTWCLQAGETYTFKNIGIRNGMSNGFVVDVAIDKRSFLWAATESGLNRIAGPFCTSYTAENSGLLCNALTSLYYDAEKDKLCIGTQQGLSIYDCRSQKFTNLTPKDGLSCPTVNGMFPAKDGRLLIVLWNGDIQRVNLDTYKLTKSCFHTGKASRSVCDDGKGHLLVGHIYDGMSVVDTKNHRIRHYRHERHNAKSVPGNNVRAIHIDYKGRVWIGTEQGLALFNPASGDFTSLPYYDKDNATPKGINVNKLLETKEHQLWIASDMGGISVVDLEKFDRDRRMVLKKIDNANSNLSSINTRSVAQDKYGNIWVGSHNTGIDFLPLSKPAFSILPFHDHKGGVKRVYGLATDTSGNLWLGGEDELTRWGGQAHKTWSIRPYLGGLQHSFIRCILTDKHGMVWLGVEDVGVLKFNPADNNFIRIPIADKPCDIRSFYEDEDGKIWICSELGVYSYDRDGLHNEKAVNRIINSTVATSLAKDWQGNLIVGTLGGGVYCIDGKTWKSVRITTETGLPDNSVNQVLRARDGSIWIATYGGLAFMKNIKDTRYIRFYDEKQGLANHHIRAISQDRFGRIWVSTYTGISCLDTRKHTFYNYNNNDETPIGSFVEASSAMSTDGSIYFGSPTGVCYFNPQEINQNRKVSPIRIIGCQRLGSQSEGTLYTMMSPDSQGVIHLKYNENTFKFEFTVENFAQGAYVDYAYMMKGLEDKWYDVEGGREVTFRKLPPGRYTLRIRAKLKNQDWKDATETEATVIVHPPLWQTWWAYLIYILLAAGAVWYYMRSYKHKLKLENSLELERRNSLQKHELNEERLRFFTNITHELRTPLTLILGPLEDLANDKRLPDIYRKKVELIDKSAGRLHALINEILEFRKVETQNRQLTVAKGDLGSLVEEIGQHFRLLNSNPKTTIQVTVQPDIPPLYFDSEIITTVVNNFMSNAIKYTPQGSIRLTATMTDDDMVDITVEDTGYGISREALPHIFERYTQSKGKHQAEGTGIGLALVKSLADLHEAHLAVESEVGKGSKFTFSLFIKRTYPNALHKDDEEETLGKTENEKAEHEDMSDEGIPLLLIVEDNKDIRRYIADSMEADYRVVQAADGCEGTKLAMELVPDIIVSDIMMPCMDGIELAHRVKEDIRTSHIPIILLTAKDSAEDKEEGYDSGADSYLTKPFSARLLQSRIRNLLRNRRRLAELLASRSTNPQEVGDSEGFKTQAIKPDIPKLSRLDREFMDRLNNVLKDNITTEVLNMDFLSDKMAMSYSAFYRKLKALTGMTVKEYVNKRRLQRCAELLKSGDYNVSEAAAMTGFYNLNNFRIVFKKEFGVPPSEYAKNRLG